ncbi:MAG: hypothetical protein ACREJC_06510 [Tepidisphaeraceae bacterium]
MSAKRHRACYCARVDGKTFCSPSKRRASRRTKNAAKRGSSVTKVKRHKKSVYMGYGF